MTEEIIIDGVNVAGCEYISDIDCSCIFVKNYYGTTTKPRCSQVKNCHYKQLKRAEIEIEKLKGVDGSVHPDSAYYKITRLEQENKELKEQIESQKGLITVGGKQQYEYLQEIDELEQENKALKDNNNHLRVIIDDGRAENKRFREENKELKEYKIEHKYSNAEYRQEREAVIQLSYYRNKYKSALEKIRELCIHYKNTNDKCVTNCYAHFIVTDLIQNKINEVLG